MHERYYQDSLYPLQDAVLGIMEKADLDFYLTGGTALSRCYLGHRYSDDLDFFVNALPVYKQQVKKIVSLLKQQTKWLSRVTTTSESFVRVMLETSVVSLKIDFVNDIKYRYGKTQKFAIFNKVDNWRNILSNKISALSRMEPKDVVDVVYISRKYAFSWEEIIFEAKEKDLWVDPIEICRLLSSQKAGAFDTIKWTASSRPEALDSHIKKLQNDIFYGKSNSLVDL